MDQFDGSAQIEALKYYEHFDNELENGFEEFIELAALICRTCISLISFTETKKQLVYLKPGICFKKNIQENIFFNYAIENPDSILEVPNALEDKRFRNNTLVTDEPNIIFCVVVPLILLDGNLIGALCVMDQKPGKLSEQQLAMLKVLSKRIVKQFEFRKNLFTLKRKHRITYQRLYQITSQSPDYIFTLDRDLNITYINHFEVEVPENILYKNVTNFIDPGYRDEYIDSCKTALKEFRIIDKDFLISTSSFKRYFSVKFCPLRDKDGNPDSLLVMARDVTVSTQIMEERIKQQKILSEAQKVSHTGSCEWNIQSGEAKFSDEFYTILGVEKDTEPSHINTLIARIHPDDADRAEQLTKNAIKTFSSLLFQYRVITPKGELKYIDGRGCPLVIKDNRVISALITLHDITESVNFDKKLFTAVVQSEEKERARMAVELHDGVCQYLAGSKLMLTTTENTLKSGNAVPDLKAIAEMVRYSKSTLIDALELTRQISHNLLPVEFHKKGIIESVKGMAERLNTIDTIKYKVTTCGVDTGLDPDISINIFRIIQEFIRNSQKYSEASNIDISIMINKNEIELEIKDNGKGFDINSVEKKKGVGLLSMRKRIQSIGGSFAYETSPGNGVQLRLKMTVE